jgi:hypothetical protein
VRHIIESNTENIAAKPNSYLALSRALLRLNFNSESFSAVFSVLAFSSAVFSIGRIQAELFLITTMFVGFGSGCIVQKVYEGLRVCSCLGLPSEELKETAKAAAGANRPSKILEEAVKPTTIPDPQDRPRVAEIPTTVTHHDAIGPV